MKRCGRLLKLALKKAKRLRGFVVHAPWGHHVIRLKKRKRNPLRLRRMYEGTKQINQP